MRTSPATRHLARLSLLAMLLLALAPAVSRVLASRDAQMLAGWSQLCTRMGLQWQATAAPGASEPAAPVSLLAADGDCDYCPLASSLPPPPRLALVLPGAPLRQDLPAQSGAPAHPRRHLSGPGSRGPPTHA
jgi:hypothetical protein